MIRFPRIKTNLMKTKLAILAALLAASFPNIHANPPLPPPPGGRTGTFVPQGGYLRTVKRAQLERRVGPALGAPPIGGLKGTRRLPVICVAFKNVEGPYPAADYEKMLFGTTADRKTLTQYYRDMSNGQLNVTGNVLGWYELPKNDTYYENKHVNANGEVEGNGTGKPFGELLQFGLEQADKQVDFGEFDNDGPDGIANSGDDDGKVDTVMFVHPELGGEFRSITPDNIWSHSWHYSEPTYGHDGPFVTQDVRKDVNGKELLGANGQPQWIVVEDYVIQPGLGAPRPGQPKPIIEIGVFCHEYGHALGLPDLYDRTEGDGSNCAGVGNWCLMAAGSYGGDGKHSATPAAMSAWCKQYLGWANVVKVAQDGAVDLEAVAERNQILRLDVPGTAAKEYFLVEYRHREWQDDTNTRINWDEFLHGSGLAVWHIDERVGATFPGAGANPDWPFAPLGAGQNDAPSLPKPGSANPAAWRSAHALVSLRQADRKLELEKQREPGGDAGDLFATGAIWADDSKLLCGSRNYSAQATGFVLKEINLANFTLTANVGSAPGPGIAAAPAAPAVLAAVDSPVPALPPSAVVPAAAPHTNAMAPTVALRVPAAVKPPAIEPEKAGSLAKWNARWNKAGVAELARRSLDKATTKFAAGPVSETRERVSAAVGALNERLIAAGSPPLEDDLVENLKSYTEKEIIAAVEPKNRPLLRSLCAQARTTEVTANSTPATPAEKPIVEALKAAPEATKATVQVSPSGERLERAIHLALPAVAATIEADASERLAGALGKAATGEATVQKSETADLPGVVTFQQTLKIGEKVLPVWGAFTRFFYDKGEKPKLEAITSKIAAPNALQPIGQPGQLTVEKAQEIAAEGLQVDPALLTEGREGIKVAQGDPENARVTVRFLLPVGEKQRSLEVYVDSQSQRILSIE